MQEHFDAYWLPRLEQARRALERNGFVAHVAADAASARDLVLNRLLPDTGAASVAFGGSMTVAGMGLYEAIKQTDGLRVFDTYDLSLPAEERTELRRQGLLADLLVTGTNAVTEAGELVNLDATGNRVAGIAFGPRHVIALAGRNKLVPTLDDAFRRVRDYAAPLNAIRLHRRTPCTATGRCDDCASPDRLCNVWSITAKSSPAGRIRVVLINEDLGY
jgi:L-lactate utilization protein LutB